MEEVFNLKQYRQHLSSYYAYKCDENTFEERKRYIDRHYTDEFLQKIIDNTKVFAEYLLNKMYEDQDVFNGYIFNYAKLIDGINESYITNNCIGGWSADKLYFPEGFEPGFIVSKYLLENYFKGFNVLVDEVIENEIVEDYDDFAIGSFYDIEKLVISGPLDTFLEIYNNSKLVNKEKQRSLKRNYK